MRGPSVAADRSPRDGRSGRAGGRVAHNGASVERISQQQQHQQQQHCRQSPLVARALLLLAAAAAAALEKLGINRAMAGDKAPQ